MKLFDNKTTRWILKVLLAKRSLIRSFHFSTDLADEYVRNDKKRRKFHTKWYNRITQSHIWFPGAEVSAVLFFALLLPECIHSHFMSNPLENTLSTKNSITRVLREKMQFSILHRVLILEWYICIYRIGTEKDDLIYVYTKKMNI